MRLQGKRVGSILEEDILALKENKVIESKSLDYKLTLPGTTDSEKRKFLADVSAMANTEGGVIVYGIEEQKDSDGKNTGIPEEIVGLNNANLDSEKLRLESIIRDGLDPRLTQYPIQIIEVSEKHVLVFGIPKSLLAPHSIKFQGDGRFYRRSNSGNYQVDVDELRTMFLEKLQYEEEVEQFRRMRVQKIISKEFDQRIGGPYYILHVVPLGRFNANLLAGMKRGEVVEALEPLNSSQWNNRFTLDGFFIYAQWDLKNIHSYNLFFRSGAIEVYTTYIFAERENGIYDVNATQFEFYTVSSINNALRVLDTFKVDPPFMVGIAVDGVKGGRILYTGISSHVTNQFERKQIYLPSIIFEDYDVDVPKSLHSTFDMFWQSAGIMGSLLYDNHRKWRVQ